MKVGDLDVGPGTTGMLLIGAIHRDPRRFARPTELLLDRANARDHLSFSCGIHACAGAPLARSEGIISLQRLLDDTEESRVSDARRGRMGARRYTYQPTLLRGVPEMYLEITPRTGA